jgi:hypothetical protein
MAGGREAWEGPAACRGRTAGGLPCSNREIDGLEFCLQHLPDELLPEGELITGIHRCRHHFGQPDACHMIAKGATVPPACPNHGANAGSLTSTEAGQRTIEDQALRRLEEIMREDAAQVRLVSPDPIDNPLQALLDLAAEIRALRILLRDRVMSMPLNEWRYSKGAGIGEQTRAEIVLWERAQEREAKVLVAIAKLKIEDMLARVRKQQVQRIERALIASIRAAGGDLESQARAREVLWRELVPSEN